jgi:hypothetical protein
VQRLLQPKRTPFINIAVRKKGNGYYVLYFITLAPIVCSIFKGGMLMKNISKHHDLQRKYREKLQNKQELNTYVRGWFLFVVFAVLLVVLSYFFGGTFMPYRTM